VKNTDLHLLLHCIITEISIQSSMADSWLVLNCYLKGTIVNAHVAS